MNERNELVSISVSTKEVKISGGQSITEKFLLINGEPVPSSNFNHYYNYKLGFEDIQFDSKADAIVKLDKISKMILTEMKEGEKNRTSFEIKKWKRTVKADETDRYFHRDKEKNITITHEKSFEQDGQQYIEQSVEKKIVRERKTDPLDMSNTIIAIHANEDRPHIHIAFDERKKYFGPGFINLERKISEICKRENLCSSNDVLIEHGTGFHKLQRNLTNFSWVIEKHKDINYVKIQLSKYVSKYTETNKDKVTTANIQEKIDKYLEAGGSYEFARKLQSNLREKLGIIINLKYNAEDIKAIQLIENKDYKGVIDEIKTCILERKKISHVYKDFWRENIGTKDIFKHKLLQGVKEMYLVRRSEFSNNTKDYNRYINIELVNATAGKNINILDQYEKLETENKMKSEVISIFKDKLPINEKEASSFGITFPGNSKGKLLKYKSFEFVVTDILGKKKEEVFFENVFEFINKKINIKELLRESKFSPEDFKKNICELAELNGKKISTGWINTIAEKIHDINKENIENAKFEYLKDKINNEDLIDSIKTIIIEKKYTNTKELVYAAIHKCIDKIIEDNKIDINIIKKIIKTAGEDKLIDIAKLYESAHSEMEKSQQYKQELSVTSDILILKEKNFESNKTRFETEKIKLEEEKIEFETKKIELETHKIAFEEKKLAFADEKKSFIETVKIFFGIIHKCLTARDDEELDLLETPELIKNDVHGIKLLVKDFIYNVFKPFKEFRQNKAEIIKEKEMLSKKMKNYEKLLSTTEEIKLKNLKELQTELVRTKEEYVSIFEKKDGGNGGNHEKN